VTSEGGQPGQPGRPAAGAGVSGNVIGVGLDTVDVIRFREVLARTPSMRERCFTSGELAYADRAVDPTERLAVRFAAKEAVMKAFGVGLGAFGFHDCEVERDESGRPSIVLHGAAAELMRERGATNLLVSLTHTTIVAQAIVMAVR
jgi:holo-[acyl-carrier protein] synthase